MIQDFWNRHKGETVVIVGNGPSLDQTPLEELAKHYPTFGANKIYDSAVHPDFAPNYWTCVDVDMLHECLPWMMSHDYPAEKFIPRNFQVPGFHSLNVKIGAPVSTDASEYVVLGGTVTNVNLQLAYFMGATTALLVGVDHNYVRRAADGAPGSKFLGDEKDPDHFKSKGGSYFAKNMIYNRPELQGTGSISYPAVKKMWDAAGKRVVNLTPGTKLDVFEKGTFAEWLNGN